MGLGKPVDLVGPVGGSIVVVYCISVCFAVDFGLLVAVVQLVFVPLVVVSIVSGSFVDMD